MAAPVSASVFPAVSLGNPGLLHPWQVGPGQRIDQFKQAASGHAVRINDPNEDGRAKAENPSVPPPDQRMGLLVMDIMVIVQAADGNQPVRPGLLQLDKQAKARHPADPPRELCADML